MMSLAILISLPASAVLVDDFETCPFLEILHPTQDLQASCNVIGGVRQVRVDAVPLVGTLLLRGA